jgi:hypothetical protein
MTTMKEQKFGGGFRDYDVIDIQTCSEPDGHKTDINREGKKQGESGCLRIGSRAFLLSMGFTTTGRGTEGDQQPRPIQGTALPHPG